MKETIFCAACALVACSTPVAGADLQSAAAVQQSWRNLNATEPGIYRTDDTVFARARIPASRSPERDRIRAELKAVEMLAASTVPPATDPWTRALAAYAYRVEFSVRIIEHDCGVKDCDVVAAVDRRTLESIPVPDTATLKAKAAERLATIDEAAIDFFFNAQFPEAALALALRRPDMPGYSIRPGAVADVATLETMKRLSEKRRAVLAQVPDDLRPESLALKALGALDDVATWETALQRAGIYIAKWSPDTPLLRQVAQAQGFVRFPSQASDTTPPTMPIVKDRFTRGVGLEEATYMLENAAERSPRCPEVWEYLAAAYRAAGNFDAARIATRVWVSVAADPHPALRETFGKFDLGAHSAEVAELLR